MSDHKLNDDTPTLYVSFDEESLSNKDLAERIKMCQSRYDLANYWVDEANILMLQGSETAIKKAQKEINSFVGCEAHIYTNEELDEMDDEMGVEMGDTIQVDPKNDRILAIYLFAPDMLEKVERAANPSQLVSEFTLMTSQIHDINRALEDILEDASKFCKFNFIDDQSKSSALLLVPQQDIPTLQNHLKDSYATVVMSIDQYQKGLQPWEVLRDKGLHLH